MPDRPPARPAVQPSAAAVEGQGWMYALSDRGVQALVVLVAAAAGGFVALGVSWAGVAARGQVALQVPFVVSGAFAGVAVAAAALTLVGVHLDRRSAATERVYLDGVIRDVAGAGEVLVAALAVRWSGPYRPVRLVVNGPVVHRPDCRFATGKALPSLASAAGDGGVELRACRSCRPEL